MDPNATILIHGDEWKLSDLQAKVEEYRRRQWRRQHWTHHDALVHRQGGMMLPYVGQAYDQAEFELVRGGWKRNLCEICRWELCESDDEQHATGYTDGLRWICTECYDFLVRRR